MDDGDGQVEKDNIVALLEEIRDAQQRHFDEYRRVTGEALALQKQSLELQRGAVAQQTLAVQRQGRHLRLYRYVIAVAALVAAGAIWLLSRYA